MSKKPKQKKIKFLDAEFSAKELFAMWTAVCSHSPYYSEKIYSTALKAQLYELLGEENIREMREKYAKSP